MPGAPPPPPPPPCGDSGSKASDSRGRERPTRVFRFQKIEAKPNAKLCLWNDEADAAEEGTLRRMTSRSQKDLRLLLDEEKDKLFAMFAKNAPKTDDSNKKNENKTPQILCQSREKNVGIVLQVLKTSMDLIEKYVLELKTTPTFGEEAVAGLLTIVPQVDELKAVAPYQKLYEQRHMPADQQEPVNNLTYAAASPPVQFFLMAAAIPDFQRRLECWHTALTYEREANEVREDMKLIREAITYVRDSKHFPRVLELILTLGNFLNTGGDLSGSMVAKRFCMSDLSKVVSLRTTDDKSTLLKYLVDLVSRRDPAAHKFAEELEPLAKNITSKSGALTKLDFQALTAAVRTLGLKIRACRAFLSEPPSKKFTWLSSRQVRTARERLEEVIGNFLVQSGEPGQHALIQEMEQLRRQCVSFSEYLGEEVKGPFPADLQTPVKSIGDFARDYADTLKKREERLARLARMKVKPPKTRGSDSDE